MSMEYRLIRTVTCYLNQDESLVFDVRLEGFDLPKFQAEFGVGASNPMYDSYSVTVQNLSFLKSYLPNTTGINWDFNKFSYFVEAVEN